MMTKHTIQALLTSALIGLAGTAAAAPVATQYVLTGTPGDWTLNFDVANNLPDSDQSVYFFGVAVNGGTVVASPADFSSTAYPTWSNNARYGGSSLTYDGVWISGGHVVVSGVDLAGFLVHTDAVDAPTDVSWFVFTSGSAYGGGGHFNTVYNPGWEGVASAQVVGVVPEPTDLALMLGGLGLCALGLRRRALTR